jgi:hypothetical protein
MATGLHTGVRVTVAGQVPLHGPIPPDTVPLTRVIGNRQFILDTPVGAAYVYIAEDNPPGDADATVDHLIFKVTSGKESRLCPQL